MVLKISESHFMNRKERLIMTTEVEEMLNEYITQSQDINDEIEATANDARDEAWECCWLGCCLACLQM